MTLNKYACIGALVLALGCEPNPCATFRRAATEIPSAYDGPGTVYGTVDGCRYDKTHLYLTLRDELPREHDPHLKVRMATLDIEHAELICASLTEKLNACKNKNVELECLLSDGRVTFLYRIKTPNGTIELPQ